MNKGPENLTNFHDIKKVDKITNFLCNRNRSSNICKLGTRNSLFRLLNAEEIAYQGKYKNQQYLGNANFHTTTRLRKTIAKEC